MNKNNFNFNKIRYKILLDPFSTNENEFQWIYLDLYFATSYRSCKSCILEAIRSTFDVQVI